MTWMGLPLVSPKRINDQSWKVGTPPSYHDWNIEALTHSPLSSLFRSLFRIIQLFVVLSQTLLTKMPKSTSSRPSNTMPPGQKHRKYIYMINQFQLFPSFVSSISQSFSSQKHTADTGMPLSFDTERCACGGVTGICGTASGARKWRNHLRTAKHMDWDPLFNGLGR